MEAKREVFESELEFLGLIAFENKVKEEVGETMEKLSASNIDKKIITGDNIYIAVETAMRCGIIGKDEKVMIL